MMLLSKPLLRLMSHSLVLLVLMAAAAVTPATALDFSHSGPDAFCSTLDGRQQRIDSQLTEVQTEVRQTWQQQNERLKVMVSEQQSSGRDLTRIIDAQRNRNLSHLHSKSTSSAQRTAIDNYVGVQQEASTTRRSTIAEANNSFTAALKRYVANRQATQAGQVEALRINLDDALQTASGQCATSVASKDVAANFTAAVQTSRQTYLSQRKSDSAIVAQVQDLSATRKQTTTTANQIYITTMTQARQSLQAALK